MRIIGCEPPHGVLGNGIYYPIRTDFGVWLEFARILEEEEGARAAMRALRLCYKDKIPLDFNEALSLLCIFFAGGKAIEKTDDKEYEPVISFSKDEELIYASFLSDYGIDLSKEKLHWWRFLALLKNLSSESALMKVAQIRAAKPSDIKNPLLRRQLLRQKQIYSLGTNRTNPGDVMAELFAAEKG
ncbi:MAG: Gp15 family bacteriophage protein [Clostridia bacterium]|nr:Gp15 family bacteriophage protein [Clostridia bacterium]